MDNILLPLILILFISIVYFISMFFSLHDRVIFYEEMEEGMIYQLFIDDYAYPLSIVKLDNKEFTTLADIIFDGVEYFKVPSPLIYNIVRKPKEYSIAIIYKELEKYKDK